LEDNESWDNACPIAARYTDIDVNNHVTAARYLGWIVDSYPVGFHASNSLRALDINYLSETVEGEQLTVRARQIEPTIFLHSLAKSNGAEVCRARLEWEAH
jgi:acyl-ACP thioesterase